MWHFEERRYSVKWYEELPVRREASSHVSVSVWEGGWNSLWRCTGLHRGYNCTPFSMLYSESYEKKRKTSWQKQFWSFPCRFLGFFFCLCLCFSHWYSSWRVSWKKGWWHTLPRTDQSWAIFWVKLRWLVWDCLQTFPELWVKTDQNTPTQSRWSRLTEDLTD